ncbi:MAG: hypothetical protein JXB36_05030 [Gammaproteobacteria bacterium]|nr:hypothetical protein [Gammaproteobacteria bacterium]
MAGTGGRFAPGAVSGAALALITAVMVFSVHRVLLTDAPGDDSGGGERAEPQGHGDAAENPEARAAAGAQRDSRLPDGRAGRDPDADAVAALSPDAPESFRNTSILIAIRNAGFVCEDILAADAAMAAARTPAEDGEEAAWRVSCAGALVYLVGVDEEGRLEIDPVPYGEGYPVPLQGEPLLDQPGQAPRPIEPTEPQQVPPR